MIEPDFSDFVETCARQLVELENDYIDGIARAPSPDSIAYYVRTQRGHWGWKRETLASMAGTSLSTIERVERREQVSSESLDRIAVALGQVPGAFTTPRIPLGIEQALRMIVESYAPFEDRVWIPARPLRGQRQVADLARSHLYIADLSRLEGKCEPGLMDDIAGLVEFLDLVSFILGSEDRGSIITVHRREPVKRRKLYADVLNCASDIERRGNAVILVGTYEADTDSEIMPKARVSVIGFFPKSTDPAAIKRERLAVPAKVSFDDALDNLRCGV
jgi:hypothetical protein